jgi:hypothetical protein
MKDNNTPPLSLGTVSEIVIYGRGGRGGGGGGYQGKNGTGKFCYLHFSLSSLSLSSFLSLRLYYSFFLLSSVQPFSSSFLSSFSPLCVSSIFPSLCSPLVPFSVLLYIPYLNLSLSLFFFSDLFSFALSLGLSCSANLKEYTQSGNGRFLVYIHTMMEKSAQSKYL